MCMQAWVEVLKTLPTTELHVYRGMATDQDVNGSLEL